MALALDNFQNEFSHLAYPETYDIGVGMDGSYWALENDDFVCSCGIIIETHNADDYFANLPCVDDNCSEDCHCDCDEKTI